MARSHVRAKRVYVQQLIDNDFNPLTTREIHDELKRQLHWSPTLSQLGNWLAADPEIEKVLQGDHAHRTTWRIK